MKISENIIRAFITALLITLFLNFYLSVSFFENQFFNKSSFGITIFIFITSFSIIFLLLTFIHNNKSESKNKENIQIQDNEIKILKQSEKYRKEFLGNVSHELKTPLFNIQGYILTLLDGGLYDKDINYKYLERSQKNIERLISIVEDLSTISKLETGEINMVYENFDIKKIISETFEMFNIKATKNGIDLNLKTNGNDFTVNADKEKITMVITNLISNSIKYGKINGTTEVKLYENPENIAIEVTDNGIGIEQEYQTRIFERFFTVDKSRSKKLGGTGLGLSIVKHILDRHNETITVFSELNTGTNFKFSLPKGKYFIT